jgi:hypothetical protein
MFLSASTLAEDVPRDLPVPAEVIGLAVLALFVVVMAALLMFGKGRPHA